MKIALIGDYREAVTAHRAIPLAIELAARELAIESGYEWIGSEAVVVDDLHDFDAIWCVPDSPYRNRDGVLAAIRYARENDLPYLGTCAGFQHALLEYARDVLGYDNADSTEDNPQTEMPLLCALQCRLSDQPDRIRVTPGSLAGELYRLDSVIEEYNCGFGINPDYVSIFDHSGMKFSGFNDACEPRILEIPAQRFFIATAFQPERSAFKQQVHPLIAALLSAAAQARS